MAMANEETPHVVKCFFHEIWILLNEVAADKFGTEWLNNETAYLNTFLNGIDIKKLQADFNADNIRGKYNKD